jgi:hypothetical protein
MIKAIFLPIAAAGFITAGALGMAGHASAATTATGPGYSYSPEVKAQPAPNMQPGWHAHHGPGRIAVLQNR